MTVFVVFFGLPSISPQLEFSPLNAATIALTLWGSAQVAEATRGAVQSIPREQHEAAAALGFGWVGSHAFVILPQALRRLLPPLVSLLVNIIQNTTLAALIGGLDILEAGKRQNERLAAFPPIGVGESHAFEIFGAVAVLFFVHLVPADAPRRVPREAPRRHSAAARLGPSDRYISGGRKASYPASGRSVARDRVRSPAGGSGTD